MALRSPYRPNQQYFINHIDQYKENTNRLTSAFLSSPIKHSLDDKDPTRNTIFSNQMKTTVDIENDNIDVPTNKINSHLLSSVVNSTLSNQSNSQLLSTSSDILTSVNDNHNHELISDVILPTDNTQKMENNVTIYEPFVSHIPLRSSSSSASSLSNLQTTLKEEKSNNCETLVKNTEEFDGL